MNKELIRTKADKKYAAKYMERHQTLCVTLDKTEDADIISFLSRQKNRSQAVRNILREAAAK